MNLLEIIAEKATAAGQRFRETKKLQSYVFLPVIGMLFACCMLAANITAQKPIDILWFTLPAGALIFPFSYIFANILTEVYGYKWARLMIWISVLCNLIIFSYILLTIYLPGSSFWNNESAYATILGVTPLILFASSLSYLAGEHVNSFVLSKVKINMRGRHLWLRVSMSTAVGAITDSLIFIPIVFIHTATYEQMVIMGISLTLFKVSYEVLAMPLTYYVVNFLKAAENLDVYDIETKYTPFSLNLYYSDEEKHGEHIVPLNVNDLFEYDRTESHRSD